MLQGPRLEILRGMREELLLQRLRFELAYERHLQD